MAKIFPIGAEGTHGPEVHKYDYYDVLGMVTAHQAHRMSECAARIDGIDHEPMRRAHHVTWHADAVKELMSQPGAAGMRVYPAIHDGVETFVVVAVDAEGYDIKTTGLQAGHLCPPNCP